MLTSLIGKCADFSSYVLSSILINGGNIPKKIAIIMDGNRRYAEKKHIKKIQGHTDGMKALLNIIQWCINFKVEEVTAFAFSVDNFNRAKEEVDNLLQLFKENFQKFSKSKEAHSLGIKICVYGNWSFFDQEIQHIFHEIEETTKENSKIKLNVCIGYNSTEEMYRARKESNDKVSDLRKELESHLYGGYNCNPDLLIRTSGETRLSNYLLYQTRFSVIIFIDKYWPEMTFFDFFKILIRYNYNYTNHRSKIKQLEKENCFSILEKDI